MKRAKLKVLPSARRDRDYKAAAQRAGMYDIPEEIYIVACRRHPPGKTDADLNAVADARAGQRVVKVRLDDL